MDTLSYMLYAPMIVTAYLAGKRVIRRDVKMMGVFSVVVFGLVAIPSLIQFVYPALYDVLAAKPSAIINGHEYWRLLTAVAVQNGGIIGTAFNLIALFFVLQIAEAVWGARWSILLFLVAGVVLNSVATAYGVETAGNSGATFVLAASLAGCCLAVEKSVKNDWPALICVLIGLVLLILHDDHAYAILGGALIGYIVKWGMMFKREGGEKKAVTS